ncbi:hypothetical protein CHS0354_015242 [Potamilus streckersoni]|uniref:Uncharacterized protein n=1 Tax=Potamilus streckersoni TaxID=2493646 RepID=A0AAE0VIK1_9BIVA|nr:hypothetical protein CHS0354_015242 [Potamilus streckersoni]
MSLSAYQSGNRLTLLSFPLLLKNQTCFLEWMNTSFFDLSFPANDVEEVPQELKYYFFDFAIIRLVAARLRQVRVKDELIANVQKLKLSNYEQAQFSGDKFRVLNTNEAIGKNTIYGVA